MEWIVENMTISALIIGFLLDSILGDPLWLPHPVRLFGKAISMFNMVLNTNNNKKLKGFFTTVTLVGFTWLILSLLFSIVTPWPMLYLFLSSIGVFYGIANHSLIKEAYKVEKALQNQGVEIARIKLSYIVGRNTENLNKQQIRTAVLETLSENLSDGVIVPLFYYAIGGVPLMLSYKMINTLDSMIGYKSDKYKDFGWFAAQLDDVVNYIPSRITALIMAIISFSPRALNFIFKYGGKHSSPNAGYPEAALAGILNVQFGGPNYYHGKLVNKPYIGQNNRLLSHIDIKKACIINAGTSIIVIFAINYLKGYF